MRMGPFASDADRRALESAVLDHLRARPGMPGSIGADTELLETGLLDSLELLELVSFTEDRFGIEIAAPDIRPANFRTVSAFARLVSCRLE